MLSLGAASSQLAHQEAAQLEKGWFLPISGRVQWIAQFDHIVSCDRFDQVNGSFVELFQIFASVVSDDRPIQWNPIAEIELAAGQATVRDGVTNHGVTRSPNRAKVARQAL